MPRITWFDWVEAKVDAIKVVTSSDEGPAPVALSPKDHVRHALGMDAAETAKDLRPTLVYFHWPHEDPVVGKTVESLCTKVLNSEEVARWGLLFRCVQVDMSCSDPKLTALLGAGDKPSLVVVTNDAQVVSRIPAVGSSPKLQKALEAALQKTPEAWKRLQTSLAEQDKSFDKARALFKADKYAEAKPLIDAIRFGDVRVGPRFDDAQTLGVDLDQRMEREAKTAK
jgi:hypothetical protein